MVLKKCPLVFESYLRMVLGHLERLAVRFSSCTGSLPTELGRLSQLALL